MPDLIPVNVQNAREAASAATLGANAFASQSATIGDILKQKVLDVYANNQDIIGKLDTATAAYTSSPATLRAKYQNIFNPFQREALVSQGTSNQQIPMLAMASLLGQRMGRVEDTIGAGTRAFQAQAGAQQSAAEALRQNYQDLLNEYVTTEQLKPKPATLDYLNLGDRMAAVNSLTGETVKSFPITKPASTGTAAERLAPVKKNLLADAKNGATLSNLTVKYGADLPMADIVELYTSASPYGTPVEEWARNLLGIKDDSLF